jgi:hypothetical protein
VYPETGHGLRKLTHRRAKLEWDQAWIEHHVLGHSAEEEDESTGDSVLSEPSDRNSD